MPYLIKVEELKSASDLLLGDQDTSLGVLLDFGGVAGGNGRHAARDGLLVAHCYRGLELL